MSVSADQIEKLMAEQRAAGRAEVEKNEPPEPEQPPTPAPEEKAADKGPAKKGKTTGEKAPEPEKPKARRGRKPKEEKAGPGEAGGTGARRGRPPKADKAAPDKPPSPPRDKMSQGKGGKAATVKEDAPAAPAPELPPQPRDATRAEKEEIVYLKLSELFPFKDHPFGVRDDAEMKGLVASVKVYVHQSDGKIIDYYDNLENFERQMDSRFFRCHRSYLVNLDYVRGCDTGLVTLSLGAQIPVSRLRERDLTQALLRYMKERNSCYGLF